MTERFIRSGRVVLLAGSTCLAVAAVTAAPAEDTDGLRLQLSQTSAAVMVGAPFVLEYTLSNSGSAAVLVFLERTSSEQAGATLLSDDGTVLSRSLISAGRSAMPDRGFGARRIGPGVSMSGRLVVSRLVPIPHPGTYRLRVGWVFRYRVFASGASFSSGPERSLSPETTLTVTATPADDSALQAEAVSLGRTVVGSSVVVDRMVAIEALFGMPERCALGVWRDLAVNRAVDGAFKDRIIDELSRRDPFIASDLLSEIAAQADRPYQSARARRTLRAMYATATGDAKAYIGAKLLKLDGKLPKQ